jgi:uncharacterized protein
MAAIAILVEPQRLAAFCRSNGIRKLSLFGSVLTDRFREDSDIDILVEFDRRRRIGYLKMAALERELAALIRRRVDLRTPDELSPYFRDEVLRCAVVQYEQR